MLRIIPVLVDTVIASVGEKILATEITEILSFFLNDLSALCG